MTSRKALKEARSESSIYRRDGGWIFSHYDPNVRCHRTSGELPYREAAARRADWNKRRAGQIEAEQTMADDHGDGPLAEILAAEARADGRSGATRRPKPGDSSLAREHGAQGL